MHLHVIIPLFPEVQPIILEGNIFEKFFTTEKLWDGLPALKK